MLAWRRASVAPGEWDQHGWKEWRGARVDRRHWARFYFLDQGTGEAFRRHWGGAAGPRSTTEGEGPE